MMFDWFPQSWWTLVTSESEVNCTNEEMAQLLDRSFTLRRHPTQDDVNATTDTGIVSRHEVYKIATMTYVHASHRLKMSLQRCLGEEQMEVRILHMVDSSMM